MAPETSTPSTTAPRDFFATTRWTVVLAAGQRRTPQADRALEELCRAYWYPLYAYIRRRGRTREDAEDLTQAFFTQFLEKNGLASVSAEQGRFRAFLLACLKHFLANEWDKSQAQKRGGGAAHLPLDWQTADIQYQATAGAASPDQAFDREWAVALLRLVIRRLEEECGAAGKTAEFAALKPFLMPGPSAAPYAQVAAALGWQEGTVRVAAHRLRKRYRELLREEIAQTLSRPEFIEEETRALLGAFSV
jgi:RNA polymerase sigma-70 factor (ECF subfamily)